MTSERRSCRLLQLCLLLATTPSIHGFLFYRETTTSTTSEPSGPPPVFVSPDQPLRTVRYGDDTTITCEATGTPPPSVRWRGMETPTQRERWVTQYGRNDYRNSSIVRSVLILINPREDRNYTCVATSPHGRNASRHVQLVVERPGSSYLPRFATIEGSGSMVVADGTNLTIVCKTPAHRELPNWWRRKRGETSKELFDGDRWGQRSMVTIKNTVDGDTLTSVLVVGHVEKGIHDGVYRCYTDREYVATTTVSIKIKSEPVISLPHDPILPELIGGQAVLECRVTAFPDAVTTWQRNGREIDHTTDNGHKYSLEPYSSYDPDHTFDDSAILTLRIYSIDESDFGSYTCVSSNILGETNQTVWLKKHGEPEIYLPNEVIRQKIGKDTLLECTVSSAGVTPEGRKAIRWWKDGREISSRSSNRYSVDMYWEDDDRMTLMLQIDHIRESDFGAYMCVASNSVGESSKTMWLKNWDEKKKPNIWDYSNGGSDSSTPSYGRKNKNSYRQMYNWGDDTTPGYRQRYNWGGDSTPNYRQRYNWGGDSTPGYRQRYNWGGDSTPGYRQRYNWGGDSTPGYRQRYNWGGDSTPGYRQRYNWGGDSTPSYRQRYNWGGDSTPSYRQRYDSTPMPPRNSGMFSSGNESLDYNYYDSYSNVSSLESGHYYDMYDRSTPSPSNYRRKYNHYSRYGTKSTVKSLADYLLKSRADHPEIYISPFHGPKTDAVNVTVSLSLINIMNIRKKTGEVEMSAYTQLTWNDPTLTWDPERYNGVTSQTLPAKLIWTPDIVPYSLSRPAELLTPDTVKVSHTGRVTRIRHQRLTIMCDAKDIKTKDGATCTMKFGSWTHDAQKLDVDVEMPSISLNSYFDGSSFRVATTSMARREEYYPCCPDTAYPHVEATFQFFNR